jgi:hypothetical protein
MGRSGTEGSSKVERGPPQKEKKQRMEKRRKKEKTGKKEKKKEQLKKVRLLKKTRSAMSRSMPVRKRSSSLSVLDEEGVDGVASKRVRWE